MACCQPLGGRLASRSVNAGMPATQNVGRLGRRAAGVLGAVRGADAIARPSRHEEPVIEHVRAWADAARVRGRAGCRAEHRHPRPGDAGARVGAARHAPGPPRHGLRARSGEPERSGRGPDRAGPRRRVAESGRHDARGRRRRRDRGDDGARRGRVAPARAARAADDRRRGGRSRGRERARRLAADRLDPDQPRQRGGRRPHRRLRGQHRHVDSRRGARAARRRRRRHARAHARAAASAATRAAKSTSGASNAIKVLGRVLREAYAAVPFRLVSLAGGKSRNAIPRDAGAVCSVAARRRGASSATAVESATARSATRSPRPIRA